MTAILWLIVIVVGGLLAYAATQPDSFRLERSASMKAKPESIFALINDFHAWPKWSPWEKLDADLKRSYSGPASGVGSSYIWEGKKAGSGKMTIAEAEPAKRILIDLEFTKPFKASNKAEFTLKPEKDGTRVTWAMFGPQPFLFKLMGLFYNSDKLVGPQFEEGLINLKRIAESTQKQSH